MAGIKVAFNADAYAENMRELSEEDLSIEQQVAKSQANSGGFYAQEILEVVEAEVARRQQ